MNHNENEERIARRSAPRRRRRKSNKALYYLILAVLFGILIFSGWKIISYISDQRQSEKQHQQVIDDFVTPAPDNTGTQGDGESTDNNTSPENNNKKEEPPKKPVVIEPDQLSNIDWEGLKAKYPDVVGYIYCANTGINYPIMQSSSNDFYLTHGIDGKENANGAIFMEHLNSSNFSDGNTIIYGHNMKTGNMFAPLQKYNNQGQSYYDVHPYMYIYTPTQNYRLDLFAGCRVDHDADIYSLSVDESTLASYVAKSTFKSSTGVPKGKIVTLSTCSYEVSNGRYVVLGELTPID